MKKKVPWGTLSIFCATEVFFVTLAIVVIYLILKGISGATSGTVTIFHTWYQILLFCLDLLLLMSSILFAYYFFRKKRHERIKEEKGVLENENI